MVYDYGPRFSTVGLFTFYKVSTVPVKLFLPCPVYTTVMLFAQPITILLLLLMMAGITRAQDAAGARPPADLSAAHSRHSANQNKQWKIIKAELALTDKQSQQWQTLNTALESSTREILQHNTLTPAQKQELLTKAQQDHEQHIKALLTANQYQQYVQWNAKRLERLRALKRMEDRQLPGRTTPGKN